MIVEDLHQWILQFDCYELIDWMADRPHVPIIACSLYLLFIVFLGPVIVRRFPGIFQSNSRVKSIIAGASSSWNLFLAVFSFAGSYFCAPRLWHVVSTYGYKASVCTNPTHGYYSSGYVGFFVALFIWSKIPELSDTVFLVLQGKPVIFLHWYHHVTVLLFCWHAYITAISTGLWFATMNYLVHSVMYLYFFLTSIRVIRSRVTKIAPLITIFQISQMVMGTIVTVSAQMWYSGHDENWKVHSGEGLLDALSVDDDEGGGGGGGGGSGVQRCFVNSESLRWGLIMYGSYFILFLMFFREKMKSGSRKKSAKTMKTM